MSDKIRTTTTTTKTGTWIENHWHDTRDLQGELCYVCCIFLLRQQWKVQKPSATVEKEPQIWGAAPKTNTTKDENHTRVYIGSNTLRSNTASVSIMEWKGSLRWAWSWSASANPAVSELQISPIGTSQSRGFTGNNSYQQQAGQSVAFWSHLWQANQLNLQRGDSFDPHLVWRPDLPAFKTET